MEKSVSVSLKRKIQDILSLAKPRLSLLVLCTTAGGVALAPGTLSSTAIVSVVFFTFLLVAAANGLNCCAEVSLDALMERTRNRPLPAGRLSQRVALGFGWTTAIVAFLGLMVGSNLVTALLGALAFISYVFIYTPLKTRTPAALVVGAVPGALPPLMGWTAVTGQIEFGGCVLFVLLFFWQIPHFLAISLYLAEDYARAGFRVFSVVHGVRVTKVLIVASTILLAVAAWSLAPLHMASKAYGYIAIVMGCGMFLWSLRGLCETNDRHWAREMFVVSIVFMTVIVGAMLVLGKSGVV